MCVSFVNYAETRNPGKRHRLCNERDTRREQEETMKSRLFTQVWQSQIQPVFGPVGVFVAAALQPDQSQQDRMVGNLGEVVERGVDIASVKFVRDREADAAG